MYFITGLLKSVFGCCIAFSLSARHTVRKSGNMYLHSADVSQIYLHSADVSQIYLHQIYISQRYIWRSGFTIHISSEISEQYLCSRYNVNVRKKQKCKNTKKRKQVFFLLAGCPSVPCYARTQKQYETKLGFCTTRKNEEEKNTTLEGKNISRVQNCPDITISNCNFCLFV